MFAASRASCRVHSGHCCMDGSAWVWGRSARQSASRDTNEICPCGSAQTDVAVRACPCRHGVGALGVRDSGLASTGPFFIVLTHLQHWSRKPNHRSARLPSKEQRVQISTNAVQGQVCGPPKKKVAQGTQSRSTAHAIKESVHLHPLTHPQTHSNTHTRARSQTVAGAPESSRPIGRRPGAPPWQTKPIVPCWDSCN